MEHIARADVNSPYISLTRSYGIAYWYAVFLGRAQPTATETNPGYVYEIELSHPLPPGLHLLDPVKEVAAATPKPTDLVSYQHDGLPDFILGLVSHTEVGRTKPRFLILETFLRALRDAEILAVGNIPATYVRNRYEVWKWPIEEQEELYDFH